MKLASISTTVMFLGSATAVMATTNDQDQSGLHLNNGNDIAHMGDMVVNGEHRARVRNLDGSISAPPEAKGDQSSDILLRRETTAAVVETVENGNGSPRKMAMALGAMPTTSPRGNGNSRRLRGRRAISLTQFDEAAQVEAPGYLFVQMATECRLAKQDDGSVTLSSESMGEQTWAFTDRPVRYEKTVKTGDFFDKFSTTFSSASGGAPNAAITLTNTDGTQFDGPLIASLVDASSLDATGAYVYTIEQSAKQASALGLEQFFADESNEAVYDKCSIFIDIAL